MIPVEYAIFVGFGLYILNLHSGSCTHIYILWVDIFYIVISFDEQYINPDI